MLERFTEKARRTIFFARYEASQYGYTSIEAFHLLLGLVREDKALFRRFKLELSQIREIYERLFPQKRERISTAIEVPLTPESKIILKNAAVKADKLGHKHVGTEHLFLSMLAESGQIRDELGKLGLTEAVFMTRISDFAIRVKDDKPEGREILKEFLNSGFGSRTGIGYDLHRLEAGRRLRIGGIEVPFDKGSVGHSDGDVLAHAICDALLGAAGLGDIGTHFPDTDPKWKGADSLVFLKHVRELYDKDGLLISHIDAIVIAERPKLGPHFADMRKALANALGIGAEQINLKAKTNEGVDAIGRGEAIAAHAVATIAG
jgi:2-C-methyl-D-erythritol 2,4-cyclodiphosphate synthase